MKDIHKKSIDADAFKSCGIMNERKEIIDIDDQRHVEEENVPSLPELTTLSAQERIDEWWEDGWLRLFTDGSVSNPTNPRIDWGGGGLFYGKEHPYNTATKINGKKLNSFRAEIQMVSVAIQQTPKWFETMDKLGQ